MKASTVQQRQAASRAKKAALAIPKPSKKVKNLVESMQVLRVDELNSPATRNVNADPMRANSRGGQSKRQSDLKTDLNNAIARISSNSIVLPVSIKSIKWCFFDINLKLAR